MMKENIKFFEELLNADSPSGWEFPAIQVWERHMKEIGLTYNFTDSFWNSAWSLGSKEPTKKIMFSGHIDNNSFLVQNITETGFVQIIKQGGSDDKTFYGQDFEILTESGSRIPAFISKRAIHLDNKDEEPEKIRLSDMVLDCGCTSKKEVEKLGIQVGDIVVFKHSHLMEFGPKGDFIVSDGLDDKVAIYIISEVARRLIPHQKEIAQKGLEIYFVAMTQEEVGARSCGVATRRIDPQISIDLDVDHVVCKEIKSGKEAVNGNISFNSGPILSFGPDKNRELVKVLANGCGVKTQRKAGRAGGTNTDTIQKSATDCQTALISIPNLYMHTTKEKCAWSDIEDCIKLCVNYIKTYEL